MNENKNGNGNGGDFESLRLRHTKLMEEMEATKDRSTLVPQVEAFILEARKAGTYIARSEERDVLKGILNFWGGFVFEQTEDFPNTELYPSEQPIIYQQAMAVSGEVAGDVVTGMKVATLAPAKQVVTFGLWEQLLMLVMVFVLLLILAVWLWSAFVQGPEVSPTPPAEMSVAGATIASGPAKPGEMLVILAQFEGSGPFGPITDEAQVQALVGIQAKVQTEEVEEANPATVLLKEVQKRLSQVDALETENQRFWLTPEVITTTRRALDIGELNGATLVIWGAFEGSRLTVNFQTIKDRGAELRAETRALENVLPLCSLQADVEQGGLTYLTNATLGQLYYWAGYLYGCAEYCEAAKKFLSTALQSVPENLAGTWGEEDLYFYLGLANLDSPMPGYYEAITQYSQAIPIYEEKTRAGLACISPQTDTTQAHVDLCAKLGGAYNNQGLANAALKRYGKAVENYTKALSITINGAHIYQAHNNLAVVYDVKGQQEQAEEEYKAAASWRWPQVYQNQGNSRFSFGDYEGAVEAYSQVITLIAGFAPTYVNRGNAHFNLGNEYQESAEKSRASEHYRKAIDDYSRAIELSPDYAAAYYARGTVYKLLGEREKAVSDFGQYLNIAPDGPGRLQAEAYLRRLSFGESVAFVSDRDGYWAIYRMNSDGTNQARLSEGTTNDEHPAWSPDGSLLVYAASPIITGTPTVRGRASTDLYIVNPMDHSREMLTRSYLIDEGAPSWSPDGKWIVCDSYEHINNRQNLYVLNSEAGTWQLLLDEVADDSSPVWSPDGDKIAFASTRRGNWDIYVLEIEVEEAGSQEIIKAGKVYTLTLSPADDWAPAWSSDGEWLAFTSERDGNAEIYVMTSKGKALERLTYDPAGDYQPSWSPDDRIIFYSDRDGNREIYVMDRDGEGLTRLTHNKADDVSPVWAPR